MAAVAARYARALVDVVARPGAPAPADVVREQVRQFTAALEESAELRAVLANPAVPVARKRSLVEAIGRHLNFSQITLNFLFVLADHRRLGQLRQVLDAFETLLDERLGIVRADVSSAVDLPAAERAALEEALRKVTGKQVRVNYAVDPSLIGGAVTRIGSTIYDGSVREQLRQMRQRLTTG